ncbi:serine/threonine-protein kinase-like protein At3g51990 [Salvia miltiorrhiza]|uniref:serine/threonine-protein kinase-like protein At3g51990 n=1 Tax=Salvia miltiorrhiza TaxID=226208 RepID=UPI0025ABB0DF|nr:serine/threonine-protein kinase-like protein At3g51990 [Salvia miltiorrhiza]
MGYLSCNEKSAIAICDSYNWELLSKNPRKIRRPFKIAEFDLSDLHSATDGFSAAKLLGKGSHGWVYKAELQRLKLVAAVKKTKAPSIYGGAANPADNELEILSRIYHPRLVNLIGFAVDPNQHKLIVVEYMPNGSLFDLLHGSRRPPGWVKRTRFALQVAWAVQFLHSSQPPIIHRDIKSSNVLIDADFNSRISDFGLALRGHVEDVRVRSTPPAGTLGYLDPGYLAPGDLSTKSDVFSFGILLLEIISGRNAIDVNYSPPSVVEWALPEIESGNFEGICDPRIGPPDDAGALRRMAVLAARCVRCAAERRPGMEEVVECLKGVYKRMKMQSQICVNVGRRVAKYEALDDGAEVVRNARTGSRRNGKVSSVASVQVRSDVERVGRSKSMGSGSEIKYQSLDGGWRRVKMSKSKSMGINALSIGSTKWEESKLLVDLGENVGGEEK